MSDDVQRDLYSFLHAEDLSASDRDSEASEDGPDAEEPAPEPSSPEKTEANSETEEEPDFDDKDVGDRLKALRPERLHTLDFGVIRLDDEGVVQFYSRSESELSGIDPEEAAGRNFFTDLAPCSNNRIFMGSFRKGVDSGDLDERFTYTFTYKMRPTLVDIRLYRDDEGTNWLLVKKR